jgi:putative membrane-bound dehydrogenase-like protein
MKLFAIITQFKKYSLTSLMRFLSILILIGMNSCSSNKNISINESSYVQILFLGHNSEHHDSEKYLPILASTLIKKGIHFTYSADPADLTAENLAKYDGLALYANHEEITKSQEKALLDYVNAGGGFIPIHCASACFKNSEPFIKMVGGQFKEHGKGVFTADLLPNAEKTITGIEEFETWDETYVHYKLNPDINILMERVDGEHKEPWTWVNTQGKGRVFYTAYGHDERTWSNEGFHNLMAKGILWAVGEKSASKVKKMSFPAPTYTEAKIPNYEKRDPPLKLQTPLSPKESMKLTQVPVGFELELFAAEPDIINPISMGWDEKGRLWVIETVDYPNTVRSEDGVGDDRVKICEDTNGDGKADKFTVFADGLNLPTSLVFSNGGIIVSQAPHFLFLKDTDGDDKADIREIILTGWGTFDTHAGPSNLKYGFDNKIWGTVGYSGYSGQVNGTEIKFKQGIFQFNPNGSGLTQLSKTSNNTWGLGFSENFDVFASTANNTHSVFMGISNSYLKGIKGLPDNGSKKIDGHYSFHPVSNEVRQVDVFGGFTAAAGANLYTARSFPKEYWNRISLVCEPTGRLIHNAILEENGSGFKERDGWNLAASNDNWFGPVHAEVGPDGAVWFADWYNFIIQHNPTPPGFENGDGNAHINPLRDRTHGRIYRLTYKGAKKYDPISLSINDPSGLIKALKNDNLFWRSTAQRLLVERGETDVVPELLALIRDKSVDEIGINPGAIHALWTLSGLGAEENDTNGEVNNVILQAMNHPSAGVRKAAIQIMPKTSDMVQGFIDSNVLSNENKYTQLAAILGASEFEPSQALGSEIYKLSLNKSLEKDEWIPTATYLAAVKHQIGFINDLKTDNQALISDIENESNLKPVDLYAFDLNASNWGKVEVPGLWEKTEIGDVDGVIWFRKEINLPQGNNAKGAILNLGPVDDSDETWVNGKKVGGITKEHATFRSYKIPSGVLRSGKNVIAVKVTDTGGGGGLWASKEEMNLDVAGKIYAIAGQWNYKVGSVKGNSTKPLFDLDNSLAKVFLKNYYSTDSKSPQLADGNWPDNAKKIEIKTIVNEMKYDVSSFEVEAGQALEIRFKNIDFMQHNLLIIKQGSLKEVGAAADELASKPNAAEMNYIPKMDQVLYSTQLVNPDSEVVLRFIAPKVAGDYPFVCTFPGHWRIMNGVMKVTHSKSS